MDILVCIQHNFVMPCGVLLLSLITNNSREEVHIHCICNRDVTNDDKASLRKIVEGETQNSIQYYTFQTKHIDSYPGLKGAHFGESTYYRLFSSSILPTDIHQVLYLDSDMIVNGSLNDLYATDIEGYAVAGIINPMMERQMSRIRKYLDDSDVYINGGVQLINLDYWRSHRVENAFVEFIEKDPQWILYVDQDVLNVVLKGKIKLLPIKYNLQHQFLYKDKYLNGLLKNQYSELKEARENPVIVHFTGPDKPWMRHCKHPFTKLFEKYQNKTEWKGVIHLTPMKELLRKKRNYYTILLKLFIKEGEIPRNYFDKQLCKRIINSL